MIQPLKRPLILHIEDSKIHSLIFKSIIKEHFDVVLIENGKLGLSEFLTNKDKYDLILCDYNLPEVTGSEVIQEIRKINDSIPIIANSSSYNNLLMDAGANFQLPKSELTPSKKDEIIKLIYFAINSK